jgi:hypothetical protein
MPKERMKELFKEYDPDVQELVAGVLASEQEYISFELNTNSRALREIKDNIRETIEQVVSKNEA